MTIGKRDEIILWDTEFWAARGSQTRHWAGLRDFPPLLIQIVAAKVRLSKTVEEIARFSRYVRPVDEFGRIAPLGAYFTNLTGITQEKIDREAVDLHQAMPEFAEFARDTYCYSFGLDNLATIVPSCYVRGVVQPLAPKQARDLRHALARSGLSEKDMSKIVSGQLADFVGATALGDAHNAESDVDSLISALLYLKTAGRIENQWLTQPQPPNRFNLR